MGNKDYLAHMIAEPSTSAPPKNPAQRTMKQIIHDEYIKCAADPVYFMSKYCYIQHPVRGKVPFILYPFQKDTLYKLRDHDYNIILKSRQLGISTLVAAYSLWLMTFNSDKNILVIATKQEVAKNLVTKVRIMQQNLPSWLKNQCIEDNKLSLRLKNGSQIKAVSSSPDAGRSEALSLLIIDEAAFVDNIDEIWTSAQQTLATGGRAIILSTPNGVGGFFHRTWVDAEVGANKFNTIKLVWDVHPERNQEWRDKQDELLGVREAAQECLAGRHVVTVKDCDGEVYNISLKELYEKMESSEKNTLKILSPTGFKKFTGVVKRTKNSYVRIHLDDQKTIECSLNHIFISLQKEVFAGDLQIGDSLDLYNGNHLKITNIEYIQEEIELYDVINVHGTRLFIVDDIISHNCDADFISSGNSVVPPDILEYYNKTYVCDPIEKRGIGGDYWIWQYPDYTKTYVVSVDVARGDGNDYSALQVLDVDTLEQVAEYRAKVGTKEFGNFCVAVASEYNNALLVIENANIGWAVIQEVIDRNYPNLFYSSKDLTLVDTSISLSKRFDLKEKSQLTAGFTTTMRTKPLIISKMDSYFREVSVVVHSKRLITELFTYIFNGSKTEAMSGYNDDLVMSYAIGLWVRDTAIRLKQEGIELQKMSLNNITKTSPIIMPAAPDNNPWKWNIGGEKEDLTWLV